MRLEKGPTLWELTLISPEGKPPTLDFQVLLEIESALDEVETAVNESDAGSPSCLAISSSSEKCFCAAD
ncbi:MAG: hypothetical protein CMI15_15260 [Opitutaceae bacterium]|nr:hypothetical protein [Opitutaceae bacterium]